MSCVIGWVGKLDNRGQSKLSNEIIRQFYNKKRKYSFLQNKSIIKIHFYSIYGFKNDAQIHSYPLMTIKCDNTGSWDRKATSCWKLGLYTEALSLLFCGMLGMDEMLFAFLTLVFRQDVTVFFWICSPSFVLTLHCLKTLGFHHS